MSRRHSSSRRRSYGGRQHEVRERRTDGSGQMDWDGRSQRDDWRLTDFDDDIERRGLGDSRHAQP